MPHTNQPRLCYYNPRTHLVIDLIRNNGRSYTRNQSQEQMLKRFPGAEAWAIQKKDQNRS